MPLDEPRHRTLLLVILGFILVFGIFLRLPSDLFSPNSGALRSIGGLHATPGFQGVGFDENLYRAYVNELIRSGLTSYPDLAENYVEVQKTIPGAILPPTRFLYIFFGYLWHVIFKTEALAALHNVSSLFSVLLLLLAAVFTWRLGGLSMALPVSALMACAPTQIHMGQHALIDGFFAFWATLCLWLLWENLQKPGSRSWLVALGGALALLVLAKENALFAYLGLLVPLGLNRWLGFGKITRTLLATMLLGPLLGVALLVNLCSSLTTTIEIYRLLISKASVLPYAIATGDGPWYRYLVDLMIVSPIVLLLAAGAIFALRRSDRAPLYLLSFVAGSYLLMANVRYGMNLRYANMWDLPLRYLGVVTLTNTSQFFGSRAALSLGLLTLGLCSFELHQYFVFFVANDLYELVTRGLLHAVKILK